MGSDPEHDKNAQADDQPQHEVRITQGFWLDQYTVTNAYFKAFTDDGGYQEDRWWSTEGLFLRDYNKLTAPKDYPNLIEDPMQPRVGIGWYEAEAYANWRGGRLPTEAEWEYAARGEHSPIYPWGDDRDPQRFNAGQNLRKTIPVDAYPNGVSWCGAFDLCGNAWQWCADRYAADFYTQCVESKITDNPFNSGDGKPFYLIYSTPSEHRVLRGGAWNNNPGYCRAASRGSNIHALNDRGCRVVSAAVPVS